MKKRRGAYSAKLKRGLDLSLALALAPLVAAICCVVALWIRLDSRGSAVYTQTRVGKGGESFKIYKFRTMSADADERLAECLARNPDFAREWARTHKLKDDPRLTRAGVFLRKTSLDELPQFLNILRGEMSLVGPRPIVAEEIEKYGRYFALYREATPGLTGLWQVSGRNNASYRRRVACDVYYARNRSLPLDLKILLRTIPAALGRHGAY